MDVIGRAESDKNETCILKISRLKICSLTEPLGIDQSPIFSWEVFSTRKDEGQKTYRIILSDHKENIEDSIDKTDMIWDSGEVISDNTTGVCYSGPALLDHTVYYWRVAIQSQRGGRAVSEVSRFSTGYLQKAWRGIWIGMAGRTLDSRSAILLRKSFLISKPIAEAYIYICGLGFFTLDMNAEPVDDSVLNPLITQYDETVSYRTFEVTHLLKKGNNVVDVMLGNSYYNEIGGVWNWQRAAWRDIPKMIFRMDVRYADGSSETIVSDSDWKARDNGPIRANSMYYGEVYDARMEREDGGWSDAVQVKPPLGTLRAQMHAPIRRIAGFKPEAIVRLGESSWRVQSPEMMAGWIKLSGIRQKTGDKITFTYGQKLEPDGSVHRYGGKDGELADWYPDACFQQDIYYCSGQGEESYEPVFSYKGFEYVQIDGIQGLTEEQIIIYRISNDVEVISQFKCSNDMFNRLHRCMRMAMTNNFQGEHCDPMLEKNGWLGDVNVSLDSMMFTFDMPSCMPGLIRLMEDGQKIYGIVPMMLPAADWGIENAAVWNTLLVYGMEGIKNYFGMNVYMAEHYDSLRIFALQDIDQIRENGWVWPDNQLGDWVSPLGGNDPQVSYDEHSSEGSGIVGTAFVYGMLRVMAEFASILDRQEDAEEYCMAMENIYRAFQDKFYDKEHQLYRTTVWKQVGTRTRYRQTSNLVAVAFGLADQENEGAVVQNLVADIVQKNYHLDTGCVGTRYILPVLCDYGYADVAYKIATQTTYPSWGYWLENNAKSTWEMWEASTRSFDHYFLGTYEEWFYSHLAGIQDVKNGYQTFLISPIFYRELEYVRAEVRTVRGILISNWHWNEGWIVVLKVVIPFGAEAKLHFPVKKESSVRLGGDKVTEGIDGIRMIDAQEDHLYITVGSGSYMFYVELDE